MSRSRCWCLIVGVFAVLMHRPDDCHGQEPNSNPRDVEIVVDEHQEPIELTGRVLAVDGTPAARSIVTVNVWSKNVGARVDTTINTDDQGHFRFRIRMAREALVQLPIAAASADGTQLGTFQIAEEHQTSSIPPLEIKLVAAREVTLFVQDQTGKPIEGARAALELPWPRNPIAATTDATGRAVFRIPSTDRIETAVAWKDQAGLDYRLFQLNREERAAGTVKPPEFPESNQLTLTLDGVAPITIYVTDDQKKPQEGISLYPWLLKKESENDELNLSMFTAEFSVKTNADGVATIDWFPVWQKSQTTIWPNSREFVHQRAEFDPVKDAGKLEISLMRLVPIRGTVRNADGSPAAKINVSASGAGYTFDNARAATHTNEQGSYTLSVPPNQIYLVTATGVSANGEHVASAPQTGFAVYPNTPVEGRDFVLRPATKIHGTLVDESSLQPVAKQTIFVYQYGTALNELPDVSLPNPEARRTWVCPMGTISVETDDQGRFELFLGDGSFDIRPPQQEKAEKFTIEGETEKQFDLTTKVARQIELTGRITDAETGKQLSGAQVSGIPRSFRGDDWQVTSNDDGSYRVMRRPGGTFIRAVSQDKQLAAIVEIADEDNVADLELEPVGKASGRLINPETEKPWDGQIVSWGVRVPDEKNQTFSYRFGGRVTTDQDGTFEMQGLVAGHEYNLSMDSRPDGSIPSLGKFSLEPGETYSLGDVQPPPPRAPYVPPTLEDRIKAAFGVPGTLRERHQKALERIDLVSQQLLIIFGDPEDARVKELMKIRFEDEDFRTLADEFHTLAIPTTEDHLEGASELASQLEETLEGDRSKLLLVLLNRDGKKSATWDKSLLCKHGSVSKDAFLDLLRKQLPLPVDARQLLDDALTRAKAENKRIIVQETATWCGPCHMLARFLRDHRMIWETDYIWVKMDHRHTGAIEVMKEVRNGADGGIPWFAILDESGSVMATSNHLKSKENIGFPSEKEGIEHFQLMLKATRQRMSDDDIAKLISKLSGAE